MNVYDFDKTIYAGDSSIDFYLFCVKKKPIVLLCLPFFVCSIFLYTVRVMDKKKLKENFFSFLQLIKNVDFFVTAFWQCNESKIQQWYLDKRENEDIIVSASPDFLLYPITEKLNVNLIASMVDSKTGKFIETNCYGIEKLHRLQEKKITKIDEFYSDSLSDIHLARIAQKAFLVKKNKVMKEWKKV